MKFLYRSLPFRLENIWRSVPRNTRQDSAESVRAVDAYRYDAAQNVIEHASDRMSEGHPNDGLTYAGDRGRILRALGGLRLRLRTPVRRLS